MIEQTTKFIPAPRRRQQISRWALALIVLLSVALIATTWAFAQTPFVQQMDEVPKRLNASWRVGIASLGETPSFAPNPPSGAIDFCPGVTDSEAHALAGGVALLRGTDEGVRLYDVLVENGVCIGTEDLDYNSAYAVSRWTPAAGWSESEVIIGDQFVDWLYPDVIAAILAHEATHIDRSISGTACYYVDACTILSNGVVLEEEIVAHEAEALWWIAAYGRDGKDRAYTQDASENRLKAAYMRGPDAFREFVRELRSDTREGRGI